MTWRRTSHWYRVIHQSQVCSLVLWCATPNLSRTLINSCVIRTFPPLQFNSFVTQCSLAGVCSRIMILLCRLCSISWIEGIICMHTQRGFWWSPSRISLEEITDFESSFWDTIRHFPKLISFPPYQFVFQGNSITVKVIWEEMSRIRVLLSPIKAVGYCLCNVNMNV